MTAPRRIVAGALSVLSMFVIVNPSVVGAKVKKAKPTTMKPITLLVAGASDLRPAFEEIGKEFTAKTGNTITFSFGSSGQLAQQAINGAPFDVFASADVGYVNDVLAKGVGDRTTKATYAYGRLALWVPGSASVATVSDLANPSFKRIGVANPEHAPYGVAAVEALKSTNTYDAVADRLVFGDNVSDTYRLATSGNVDAALVSLSLVIANRAGGRYIVVPADAHKPLEQTLIVTATKKRAPQARAFVLYVSSPTGRAVMRRFGFLLPGDSLPTNVS
jgi:molybdate transport system substrate-binding protein